MENQTEPTESAPPVTHLVPMPIKIGNLSYFHLRFDHRDDDEPQRVVNFLKTTKSRDILVVSEISDVVGKIHYHCLLDETRALATVREQLQKKFNFDGDRNEYSFVPAKGINNDLGNVERYLCKGIERDSYNVLYKCGKWTDELIKTRNHQYWDVNDQRNNAKQMKPLGTIESYGFKCNTRVIVHEIETKKRKSRSFIADVVERLETEVSQYENWSWFAPGSVSNHAEFVLRTLLKMHGQNFKPYGDSQIENEYNAVVQCLAPEYQTKSMLDRLKHRGVIPL